ncbi:hypothetical protein [Streptomyces sp. NBC_01304]|uniref:hypothetical protein n=1 Tax=Streptomyces sp. NBC_01304 TaxID=2903818 RepID=UPI003FA36F75|nr:hypothetical protein OG430_03175 [Streptomyces sp. NBC_01304]
MPLDQAEATLVDQYTRLVSLAYLTLPATLTRHRRVLVAHSLVQRALPGYAGFRAGRATRVPAQRSPGDQAVAAWLRVRVLSAALAYERRPRGWPALLPPPRALTMSLPVVWGLRLFPRAGGAEEIALSHALAQVPAAARAAFVLRRLDGLADREVLELLRAAGQPHPGSALRTARTLDATAGPPAETLLRSQEFDACSVQTRPTDLLRRRHRFQLAWAVTALVATAVLVVTITLGSGSDVPQHVARPALPASAPGPDDLRRVPGDDWADTSRVDFTAWPARGDRTDDRDLLTRALATWAAPPKGTRITRSPGTRAEPPGSTPQLLYAGDVDAHAVVVLHDGQRLVRYSETAAGTDVTLALARADDANVTTAAAIALFNGGKGTRYLLAPWIAESQRRDLLHPDTPGRPLDVTEDGLTEAVRTPSAGGCDTWPVLQLRSSERIVEKHAFLVTDLGGLTPAHLSYTPLPGNGVPARQPREATSSTALVSWARTACRLDEFRDDGVRAVNVWDFAAQQLPQNAGRAVWSCTRATTWRGPGHVLLQFKAPARSASADAPVVGRARSTAACSRFGQHVLAATQWKAPSGDRFLLAAGSREVTAIEASGAVDASVQGRTLAREAPEGARVEVRARLSDGSRLAPVGGSPAG